MAVSKKKPKQIPVPPVKEGSPRVTRRSIYFLLFALSGFSGLIYESIWTHYLKLFLGHAAYAQTLVLAIFMGGMAIGSWICSRYSLRWKNLLLGYAVAEGILGLSAFAFHFIFTYATHLSYAAIIPQLIDPVAVNSFKWTLAALMILPQSVLLGTTFPLMSSGILRLFPDNPGRSVAMLYFTNSIGAAIGVLVSSFMLIRLVGLPGTIGIAGLVNIALALTVWLLIRKSPPQKEPFAGPAAGVPTASGATQYRFFLLASLVTGASSFVYEIGWIRMLTLVLSASTHAFELMLSVFILGLALGGLWIQRRIDRIVTPVHYLAHVQVVMGMLALSSLPLYGNTFEVMQWLVKTLEKTDTGYALFNFSSSSIAMAIMLPTTFCAGMTLPLITFLLIKGGHGERSIGAVYAANTIGAIIGVFFAVHVGMPLLGLKGLITLGAGLDIVLGMALFWSAAGQYRSKRIAIGMSVLGIAAVTATLEFVNLDLMKMGSGVYRHGNILSEKSTQHLYHIDGKTATIDVFLDDAGRMSLKTNGKTDAGLRINEKLYDRGDEATVILLAAIPMALHPQAKSAATIGLGSGFTTQTLLGNPRLARVDTVEIEHGIVQAAKYFRPYVDLVFTDPRSSIHLDDAKSFFAAHNKKYDIIISEPSNPWISGVSGLFSEEFFRLINRSLNDDGLFAQWVQLYEINTELVVSVLKAISSNFSDFVIYSPLNDDIVIVASKRGRLPDVDSDIFKNSALSAALKRIKIEDVQNMRLRKIGSKKTLDKFISSFPIRANSDYYPVLDQNAARARFLNHNAQELRFVTSRYLPVEEMLSGSVHPGGMTDIAPAMGFQDSHLAFIAMGLRDYFLSGSFHSRYSHIPEDARKQAMQLKRLFNECDSFPNQADRMRSLFSTASLLTPFLTPQELAAIWQRLESGSCAASLSPLEKQLVALFKAIGQRDAAGMVNTAAVLLNSPVNLGPAAVKYIVASGMLGHLAQGNKEGSYRLWAAFNARLFGRQEPDVLFRLLVAESMPS